MLVIVMSIHMRGGVADCGAYGADESTEDLDHRFPFFFLLPFCFFVFFCICFSIAAF